MRELAEILEASRRVDGRVVLATVVRVAGSTYRRPGARMAFPERGEPVGLVSGGCLEADLAERARAVFASGRAETVVYDMRSPDDIVWGLGLGCNGEVRVLLERVDPRARADYLEFLDRIVAAREAAIVATVFSADDGTGVEVGTRFTIDGAGEPTGEGSDPPPELLEDARRCLERRRSEVVAYTASGGELEALLEYVAPTTSLLVFGSGSDVVPVTRLAAALGWRIVVADKEARPERFPDAHEVLAVRYDRLAEDLPAIDGATPVLVMTHHFLNDLELLQHLLPTPAPYLGFLGPAVRTQNLLEELRGRGVEPTRDQLARVHGPVGLDIGSETPEEIALSAIAEVQAVLGERTGGFLRASREPLHPRS